ncbi:ABC transporter ATP-binding protein [Methylobacterium sp. P1-11]|uniref:ABC transporter ATP-binding protein n=1 Tax=Methylobacterium sp. P1-11 TaxID=2024616 RepID=UPI0011EC6D49|nr:ABC transporter ATP-binding protein [Methylobacterium sp. P1-11]KAA0121933.1 ABC transporter ATP-binding protein [Methylobacterium sp. P1-11]
MTDTPLLVVEDLEVRYGAVTALRGASLTVRRGQLVAVIGNNGAGKTSLMRGLTGLVRPSAGRVLFKGEEVTRLPAHAKVARGLAMVPEGRLIFPDQTVEDNLILGAYAHGGLKTKRSREALERSLALFPRLRERVRQTAGSMSGGEQQMLAIARGLMAEPDLLVIDELSLGLAPRVVEQLIGVLRELNRQGLTILLVEQLASYALAIADHAYVVAQGRVVRDGPSRLLARDPEVMETFLGKKKAA